MKHTRIYKANLAFLLQVIATTLVESLVTPTLLGAITRNPANLWSYVISFLWIFAIAILASNYSKAINDFIHISHYESDLQWREKRIRLEELLKKENRTREETEELSKIPVDVWRV